MKYKFEITISGTATPRVTDGEVIRPLDAQDIARGISEMIRHQCEQATGKNFNVEIKPC